jgi:Ferritin-like domain
MAPNRITWSGATLAALLLAALLAGCGSGSSSATPAGSAAGAASGREVDAPTPAPRSSPDADVLDSVLGRQEAAIEAFGQVIPALPLRPARMAAYFRAQEQDHVDAVLKAMRGAKIAAEPSPETIDLGQPGTDRERLAFLYEVESATIEEELSAISKLETPSIGQLLAATVANQAQHLTLLRGALGAGPLASVPGPFENGTAPPPE